MSDKTNRLVLDGVYGTYTLDENESATTATCNDLVIEGQSAGVLNVDILCETYRVSAERTILESASFAWAGTVQTNENGRAVVYARFRRCIRSAGDGVTTFGNTTLAPTEFEKNAVAQSHAAAVRFVDYAKMAAMGKQVAAPEPESVIFRALRAEIATLELEALENQP
jgi:hypothetical protein